MRTGGSKKALGNLRNLRKQLQEIPKAAAIRIVLKAQGALTSRTRQTFDAGQTIYETARPLGSHGNALSLVATGDTRAALSFKGDGGSKLRAWLGQSYAKYLVGKYTIMPHNATAALPPIWQWVLRKISEYELAAVASEKLGGA